MMEKIPIICSFDKEFQLLFNAFVSPSFHRYKLNENFELIPHLLNTRSTDSGYCTQSYIIYRKEHLVYIRKYLNDHPNTEYLISIDADCIFLGSFENKILSLIQDNQNSNISIFLSRESDVDDRPNIGMMLIKNTAESIKFLDSLIALIDYDSCKHLYQIMGYTTSDDNNIVLLDSRNFINNNVQKNIRDKRLMYSDGCLFHGTDSKNIYKKAVLLSEVMHLLDSHEPKYRSYDDHSHDTSIIISRNNENLSWIHSLYQKHCLFIYDKSGNSTKPIKTNTNQIYTPLEDLGQNSYTYLHYIINYYNNLKEYTHFLCGDPFHTMNSSLIEDFGNLTLFNNHCRNNKGFFCMGSMSIENIQSNLSSKNLPIRYFCEKIFDLNLCPINFDSMNVCNSTNFIVHKDNIINRPKSFYKKLIKLIEYDAEPIEHSILAKLWPYIFNTDIPLNDMRKDIFIG